MKAPLKPKAPAWLALVKDYWWLVGVVGGSLLFWGSLPERVKKVEAGQANQQEELGAIRDATKEIQGYLKGQQALNERLAAQQQAPTPLVEEVSDDGEVKEVMWTDKKGKTHHRCCDGTDCWPWHKATKCQR